MNNISYIIFRVDFSSKIGTGHIRRCLTLANKFKKSKIIFFSREYISSDFSILENTRFKYHKLKVLNEDTIDFKNTSSWLNIDPQSDVNEITSYLKKNNIRPNLLIIDHYGIDYKWQQLFKKNYKTKILMIDDLANRKHNADFLLDTSIFRTRSDYKELIPEHTKCFFGSSYALIKNNLIDLRCQSKKNISKEILIFLSGTDPYLITSKVVKAICDRDQIIQQWDKVNIVVGNKYTDKTNLQKIIENKQKLFMYVNPEDFDLLLSNCSLLISGGGVILYEKIFLMIPSLNISMASNQNESLKYFHENNCLSLIGDIENIESTIRILVSSLEEDDQFKYHNQKQAMKKINIGNKLIDIVNLENL